MKKNNLLTLSGFLFYFALLFYASFNMYAYYHHMNYIRFLEIANISLFIFVFFIAIIIKVFDALKYLILKIFKPLKSYEES